MAAREHTETGQTPFHRGEQAIQARYGLKETMEGFGRKVVRSFMPDQHRAFYGGLPFLVIGTVDADGQPWAGLVSGVPGFLSSPTRTSLVSTSLPFGAEPTRTGLREGAPVGLLGIDPTNRRRNRMNSTLSRVDEGGFEVSVVQAFGNCPQYIQVRDPEATLVSRGPDLSERAEAIIRAANTFFIATQYAEEGASAQVQGVDVSHRGGKPGFVKIEADGTLVVPDFSGNKHFNTFGNILLDPRAGLSFIEFETGAVLFLTGAAEVVYEGAELDAFRGAERLLRFKPREMALVEGVLDRQWSLVEPSPFLAETGSWEEVDRILGTEVARNTWQSFTVARKVRESETITSFHLVPADGGQVSGHEAGQYLPVRVSIPGAKAAVVRTYTLSDLPSAGAYRISVKREPEGTVSRYLHDAVVVGDTIEALAPRGDFLLDREATRPLALISAGVGITPMIAMLNTTIADGVARGSVRPVLFLHGARNGREMAFGSHLRTLSAAVSGLATHVRFSRPSAEDVLGETHDAAGRIDADVLRAQLPGDLDVDVYLCGPGGFMAATYAALRVLGVPKERIAYEHFGPSTILEPEEVGAVADEGPGHAVVFEASHANAEWRASQGTLLDTALAAGLAPMYSCRNGVCGTCATRLVSGEISYDGTPAADVEPGEVLICSARPKGEAPVVLDL